MNETALLEAARRPPVSPPIFSVRLLLIVLLIGTLAQTARAEDPAALEAEFMRLVRAEKYAQALPLGQRFLPIAEQAVGPNDPRLAKILNNVARCAVRAGDPVVAEPLIRRALRVADGTPNPPPMLRPQILGTLGEVLSGLGRYREAIDAFQKAIDLMTAAVGADHETTLQTRQLLAIACQDQGDLNRAEAIYQDLARRNEARYGANDPATALMLRDLASVYVDIGDFKRAQPLLERVVRIFERAVGASHPMTGYVLEDLAGVYADQGRAREAIPLLERACAIQARAAGADSLDTAASLNNLASVCIQAKEYGKAADALKEALPIVEKSAPPRLASVLFHLAGAEYGLGHLAETEALTRRALAIREKSLGPLHPLTAASLDSVATLALEQGRNAEALALARRKAAAEDAVLANTLSFTTEDQRFAFLARLNPYTIFAMTGDAEGLAEAVVRRKGIILDSIIEDRRSRNDPAVEDKRRPNPRPGKGAAAGSRAPEIDGDRPAAPAGPPPPGSQTKARPLLPGRTPPDFRWRRIPATRFSPRRPPTCSRSQRSFRCRRRPPPPDDIPGRRLRDRRADGPAARRIRDGRRRTAWSGGQRGATRGRGYPRRRRSAALSRRR
ncbi:MAG: tetratricopeptide repeat protein [Armatimonadetes bacterium]|nr:tetratricopeptide repeat protein [Armatimonadota bacterium]